MNEEFLECSSECIHVSDLNEYVETPLGRFDYMRLDPLPSSHPAIVFDKKCFLCGGGFGFDNHACLVPVELFYLDKIARAFLSHRLCIRLYAIGMMLGLTRMNMEVENEKEINL